MTENRIQHPHGGGGDYEHEDLSTRSVFWFLISMAIICVLMYFLLHGVFAVLNRYDHASQGPQHPLAPAVAEPNVRRATPYAKTQAALEKTFPEPRLEEDERSQMRVFRLKEEQQLHTYGWVDEKAGVAHIPIERAMELVAERGLPVRAQAGESAVPAGKAATKAGN
jgi:hypothetical protein